MTPLRRYRKKMDWNVPALAEHLGEKESLVWKMDSGTRGITPRVADKLQNLSGVAAMAWIMPEKYHNPYYILQKTAQPRVNHGTK